MTKAARAPQLEAAAGQHFAVPFPAAENRWRSNLPAQFSSFVGRQRDLIEVARLLREHRTVTVVGSGGAGKTRLAIAAATELVEVFDERGVVRSARSRCGSDAGCADRGDDLGRPGSAGPPADRGAELRATRGISIGAHQRLHKRGQHRPQNIRLSLLQLVEDSRDINRVGVGGHRGDLSFGRAWRFYEGSLRWPCHQLRHAGLGLRSYTMSVDSSRAASAGGYRPRSGAQPSSAK